MKNHLLYSALDELEEKIFLRSDAKDWIMAMCDTDHRLRWIFENRIDANDEMEQRIKEANQQDNAALAFLSFGPRGLGKSIINYALLYKIHKSRGLNEWKKNIKFNLEDGSSIDAPSKFNQACIELGEKISSVKEVYKFAIMQDEFRKEWGKGSMKQRYAQIDAIKSLRKIGLSVAVSDNDDSSSDFILWDMQFFVFGYDPKTLETYAVMKFRRWQGIVRVSMPKNVFQFLMTSYRDHAQNDVFDQFKRGFYNVAIDPDSDDDNNISEVVSGEEDALKKSIDNRQFDEFFYDIASDHLLRKGIATQKNVVMYWVLKNLGRFRPRGKAQKLGYWTNKDIAKAVDVREAAVQKWLSQNDPAISDTDLGDCLELALLSWLNQKIAERLESSIQDKGSDQKNSDSEQVEKKKSTSSHNPSGTGAVVRRSSGPGLCDLLVGECSPGDSDQSDNHGLAINCKVKTNDRSSFTIDVLPEYEHNPDQAYAAVWTPRYGLRILQAHTESFSTSKSAISEGLCEDISLDELIDRILDDS